MNRSRREHGIVEDGEARPVLHLVSRLRKNRTVKVDGAGQAVFGVSSSCDSLIGGAGRVATSRSDLLVDIVFAGPAEK